MKLRLSILGLMFATSAFAQLPAASQVPLPRWQPLDNNGKTVPGGKICTYQTGGFSNPQATYTSAAGNVQNSNPIILDSAGRANVWFGNGLTYRVVFQQPGNNFCPGTGATIWTQDGISNAAALALSTFITTLAGPTGSANVGFLQSGSGAVAETVQAKLQQVVSVMDFGAKCDGTTDDSAAVQAAINSVGANGKVNFPQSCAVSTGIYVPSTAIGIVLEGNALPGVGATSQNPKGGLVAKSGVTGSLLSIYSNKITMRNLAFDCASICAHPIQYVAAQSGTIDNVQALNGTGSGHYLYNEGSPTTTLTSGITGGSGAAFTVANAALPGYPLSGGANTGGNACGSVMLEWGTARQETITFTVSGNTITPTSTPANNHAIGTSVQCHGSNNKLRFMAPQSSNNAGSGIDIMQGSDNNGIGILYPEMNDNTLWGMILSGSVGHILGGNYEGNGLGVIQLGDVTGGGAVGTNGRTTIGWTISNPQDRESGPQTADGTGPVVSVCDSFSQVTFGQASALSFGTTCSGGNNNTMGFGFDTSSGNTPQFTWKNSNGESILMPGVDGLRTYSVATAIFTNSSASIAVTNTFLANQPVFFTSTLVLPTNFAPNTTYYVISTGLSGSAFQVSASVGGSAITAGSAGTGVQSVYFQVATPLFNSTGSTTGLTTVWIAPNRIFESAGSNNAWSITLTDAVTGVVIPVNGVTQSLPLRVTSTHTLQAGANTITINGSSYSIVSHFDHTSAIAHAYTTNTWVDLAYDNACGCVLDMSQ